MLKMYILNLKNQKYKLQSFKFFHVNNIIFIIKMVEKISLSLVKLCIQLVLCKTAHDFKKFGGDVIALKTDEEIDFPEYYVYQKDDALYIIILSTDSFEDIITDITFNETTNKYGTFHLGFYNSAINIYNSIQKYIKNFNGTIYFVGHSLGGSVSSVLHVITSKDYPKKNLMTIAFAPAPAISSNIINDYKNKIFSFVNENDIVPLISTFNFLAYIRKHAGKKIVFIRYIKDIILNIIKYKLQILKNTNIISAKIYHKLCGTVYEMFEILSEYYKGTLKRNVRYVAGTVYQLYEDNPRHLNECEVDPSVQLNILKIGKKSFSNHRKRKYYARIFEIPE